MERRKEPRYRIVPRGPVPEGTRLIHEYPETMLVQVIKQPAAAKEQSK